MRADEARAAFEPRAAARCSCNVLGAKNFIWVSQHMRTEGGVRRLSRALRQAAFRATRTSQHMRGEVGTGRESRAVVRSSCNARFGYVGQVSGIAILAS